MTNPVILKTNEAKIAHAGQQGRAPTPSKDVAYLYAYVAFTDAIIASSQSSNVLLKQEQQGASDASKLERIMAQYNPVMLTNTKAGVHTSYLVEVVTEDDPNNAFHYFHQGNLKPRIIHTLNGNYLLLSGNFHSQGGSFGYVTGNAVEYNTQTLKNWSVKTKKAVAAKTLSAIEKHMDSIDDTNDNLLKNRDYFRGKLSDVSQNNQVIGNSINMLADVVSQETQEGMNLVQILEKMSVQMNQAFGPRRS